MWGTSSLESSEGGREAADGCSKWIFLVCNEATSPAAARACGVFSGEGFGRSEEQKRHGEDEWRKWVEVVKRERDAVAGREAGG